MWDPFEVLNAEQVDRDHVSLLEDWWINWHTPRGGPGQPDDIEAIIRPGESRPVVISARPGGGKTFYRRLAARLCRSGVSNRGIVEIGFYELNRSQVNDHGKINPLSLARCIRDSIASLDPRRSSKIIVAPSGSQDDIGYILSQCDTIARLLDSRAKNAKLYIFLDDLDKIYADLDVSNRPVACAALSDLLENIAQGACGDLVAARVFLTPELLELIRNGMSPAVLNSWRIIFEIITWTAYGCTEVAERRLRTYWMDSTSPRDDLVFFLKEESLEEFQRDLRHLEKRNLLSPREAIRLLGTVGSYAANPGAGHVDPHQPVPLDVYRAAQEQRRQSESTMPRRRFRRRGFIISSLLVVVIGLILWIYPPASAYLGAALSFVVDAIKALIRWLSDASDWLEAVILIIVVAGGALFVFWCLKNKGRSGQGVGWRECLHTAWRLIRDRLPGGD